MARDLHHPLSLNPASRNPTRSLNLSFYQWYQELGLGFELDLGLGLDGVGTPEPTPPLLRFPHGIED